MEEFQQIDQPLIVSNTTTEAQATFYRKTYTH